MGGGGGGGSGLGQTPWHTSGTITALPPAGFLAGENNKISQAGQDPRGSSKSSFWPCSGQCRQSHPVPESTARILLELWQAQSHDHSLGSQEVFQRCTQIQEPGKLPGTGSSSTLHCFFPCAKSCQQTSHPDPVATLPVWSLEKPIKHPAAPPPAPNLSISPPAGSWHGNAGNLSGLVSFEEYWQFGGLIQPNPQSRVLTQWSLKSPTTTAGAKDLAGFMEQPV